MGKYAKGQWVRVVDAAGAPRNYKVGEVGKVESDDGVLTRLEGKGGGMYSHRFEAWKPKVGERLRFVNDNPNGGASYGKKGEEVIVAKEAVGNSHHGPQVQIKHPAHDWNPSAPISALEPLPATAPVAAEAQPEAKEWVPKVGDKVRRLNSSQGKFAVGDIGTIAEVLGRTVRLEGDLKDYRHQIYNLELVTTLTIEAGKFYKTRDGRKVGSIVVAQGAGEPWPWKESSSTYYYKEDGHSCPGYARGHKDEDDLVALWEEPAVAVATSNDNAPAAEQPAKPKFKVGDRVRAIKSHSDITAGLTYEVVEVDEHDEFMPVRVLDNVGDRYWLFHNRFELVSPAAPTIPAIVALIENGTAKPATRPKVHADQASATTEAERLALEFPGQQFGVFVLADSKIADVVNVPTAVLRAA